MSTIYQSENFIVEAVEKPHVDRNDGGHIKIYPIIPITDRTEMSPKLAIEFIRLTIIVGEAMKRGLINRGVKIMRINYQDMGSWAFKLNKKPYFHLHLYGRSKNAKYQPYKEAVYLPDRSTGFYDKFKPLNNHDIKEIKKIIKTLIKLRKFSDSQWRLV